MTPGPAGADPAARVIGPALEKIIRNATWRKHTSLVASCKSALESPSVATALAPLLAALDASSPKVADPALHCVASFFSSRLLSGEVTLSSDASEDTDDDSSAARRLLAAALSLSPLSDDALELAFLRCLLAAACCPTVSLRGDTLINVVRCCYNVYLSSSSSANQLCAKLVLAQMLKVLFTRVEADSMNVRVHPVSLADMMDTADKSAGDSTLVQAAQSLIMDVVGEGVGEGGDGDVATSEVVTKDDSGKDISDIREDGLAVFKNLCKLSMKFPAQESPEDALLIRGKVLSLELLKLIIDNAGPFWCADERYLGAMKQYLCLSMVKNSALSTLSICQLLCFLFKSLLLRFRHALKEEIGIFFPMLILRVLENVLQPSFIQKLSVLNLLEKIFQEPQVVVDIFVNYDCDVDAPNIFERIVNGLQKTASGVPPGSTTTLTAGQDHTFQVESVKCLATILHSVGTWMDQQLKIGVFSSNSQLPENPTDSQSAQAGDEATVDYEIQPDTSSGHSEASSLEQRRAYKLELQKGISLFNQKPSKGIDFLMRTKKVACSPEEVAIFLKNTAGLNPTVIGEYLGTRDELPLKVMHAYVDSFKFEGMDFGEAIRYFLRGFRLPGEAQKIDRIMEKFAERYCKCNPSVFSKADTAYVLAYSVIMLNTDAHNSMVKVKMTKSDFIRNNRGISDGKDLPEEYLGALYDQIVKNEIRITADPSIPQSKQSSSTSKLLGLENIFNFVNRKLNEDKAPATDVLIKRIQEEFESKSGKTKSVFYTVTDTAILRFMMEVCWAPMMAAFSVMLDQSDDSAATFQSLRGFRYAVHVTSVMSMQTQRDAFVTSIAKFTYLHCAADMKQKNVNAVKAIMSIAIEDGDYLQEAWEHVFTCLSRFEHLHLLGEGTPTDASFLVVSTLADAEDKQLKLPNVPSSKRKGSALQNQAVFAAVRGGSYDSSTAKNSTQSLVSTEQINNLISNLNLLEQIGIFELNHIFALSQRLNSDAIVAFVKALCKVSIAELQSPTEPRIFCLTKIVEITHYNMDRIRLVWSGIWKILSDYFVLVGLLESLSVVIFVMDSLRQLSMKFLEREELANYNFQNEFLRPFVIVMEKSNSTEVKELIVRCISHMVLSRVNNIKSGWKSVFAVYSIAAADDRKSTVLLAFETMEKIVRDYFPYIMETDTTTFTDCVSCLITFTSSKFSSDASLNGIAFLRFCAVKLAEEGYVCHNVDTTGQIQSIDVDNVDENTGNKDHAYFWVPLLNGLSNLATDTRPTISRGAVEVLFDILKDHGHLFLESFWVRIFESVVYPIFCYEIRSPNAQALIVHDLEQESSWSIETQIVAIKCFVDLYVSFFEAVRSQLSSVASIILKFARSTYQQAARTGLDCLQHLTVGLQNKLLEGEWKEILLQLKVAVDLTTSNFAGIAKTMEDIEITDRSLADDVDMYPDVELRDNRDEKNMEVAYYAIAKIKGHIAHQLLIVQAVEKLHELHWRLFSASLMTVLLEIISTIAAHATDLCTDAVLQMKMNKACSMMKISPPALIRFENESYQSNLKVLQRLYGVSFADEMNLEGKIILLCEKILRMYLNCAGKGSAVGTRSTIHWRLPVDSAAREELVARTSLVLLVLQLLGNLEFEMFNRNLPSLFPLLANLISCEHFSGEVLHALHSIFQTSLWQRIST